jgi:hypothetical protein
MARMFTAEKELREQYPLSFGAHACEPGRVLGNEDRSGRRTIAELGAPGTRW